MKANNRIDLEKIELGKQSIQFMAPEILQNRPITESSATYNLGALMYQMLYGKAPYKKLEQIQDA